MEASLPENFSMEDAESSFNHWAGIYVWIAERYGVISKNSIIKDNIDQPITRIEMARMVSKADIILKGKSFEQDKQLTFSDTLLLTRDDEMYLKHAVSRGLINGYSDGTFGPDKNMTRAEAATMIYRFTK